MAAAAPFVKLLRQLSTAKEEYRSGALDITWDGGKATIFVVFGQPNHAVYDTEDGEHLEGNDALAALVHHLPRKFKVAPWRKEVVRVESLKCTMEELVEPFAQLAGAAPDPEQQTADDAGVSAEQDEMAPVHIRLETFPLLPLGESIWSEASASLLHLDVLAPKLPTSLVVLTGAKLRAAAIVIRGHIADALWVDEEGAAAGEGAAMAMIGAREGSLSGYVLEDAEIGEALTMLWRSPQAFAELPVGWLDLDRFLETLQSERTDRVLLVQTAEQRGVALFMRGRFIAAYTDQQRQPSRDIGVIRDLLGAGQGTVTVLQRAGDRSLRPISEEAFHLRGGDLEAARGEVPAGAVTAEADVAALAAEHPEAEATTGERAGDTAALAEQPEPEAATGEQPEALTVQEPEALSGHEPEALPGHEPEALTAQEPESATTEEPEAAEAEPETAAPAWEPEAGHDTWPAPTWTPSGEHDWAAESATDHEPEAAEAGAAATSWGDGQTWSPPPPPAWSESGEAPPPPPAWEPGTEYAPPPAPAAWEAQPAAVAAAPAWSPSYDEDEDESADGTGDDMPVDFSAIKQDLIQIGVRWLGSDDVAPVAQLIDGTRNQVDDFVATIEQIKTTPVAGHDPSVIRAMAREMHYYAAEALCGA